MSCGLQGKKAASSLVATYASKYCAVHADRSLLHLVEFVYHDFITTADPPIAPYRFSPKALDQSYDVFYQGELVHQGHGVADQVETADWCLASQLLGDMIPDVVVLHAAGLRLPGGKTLILSAPSGGGKSTMARALLALGCTFLSDEYVPITTDGLQPLAFPRALSVKKEETEDAEPRVRGEGISSVASTLKISDPRGPVRWVRPKHRLGPGEKSGPIAAVIGVRFAPGGHTELQPMSAPTMLAELLRDTPMMQDDPQGSFSTLLRLVEMARPYRLIYGDANDAAKALLFRFTQGRNTP